MEMTVLGVNLETLWTATPIAGNKLPKVAVRLMCQTDT